MLEILVLVGIVRSLRERARRRGASEWWAALAPLMWIGGELSVFFVAGAAGFEGLGAYPLALAYGALGVWLAYQIVDRVPVGNAEVVT